MTSSNSPVSKPRTGRRQKLKSLVRLFGPPLSPDEVAEPDHGLIELAQPAIKLLQAYFRAEVRGLDKLPEGQALIVGNHNAGITDFEPFFLGLAYYEQTGRLMHYLGHDAMVSLPVLGNLLIKLGGIRASHEAAGKAFAAGHKVVVLPGGNYEAFRPYKERYRIDFGRRTGFVRLALRHGVPIVPFVAIGGHESFFVWRRGRRLARITGVKRFLRSDS
ncbi:MAG: acyltransferase family protein, partial [Proteobacteria bacterium]|nr:acyltransferase family protein [Pseudomonadota bacterium]